MNSCGNRDVNNFADVSETDVALRIVGGIEVADPHMYPWMAGLVYESTQSSSEKDELRCHEDSSHKARIK